MKVKKSYNAGGMAQGELTEKQKKLAKKLSGLKDSLRSAQASLNAAKSSQFAEPEQKTNAIAVSQSRIKEIQALIDKTKEAMRQ